MAENKTIPTGEDVGEFLKNIPDERKRQDSFALLELMQQITGSEPVLWRGGIVGFGKVHYKYASGHEGDTGIVGFAPRKQNLTIYLLSGFEGQEQLLAKLGKHKVSKACLYINRLDDIHMQTVRELIENSVDRIRHNNIYTIIE